MSEPNLGVDVSRGEALRVWVKVALQSFGGPAGQIAVLHRLVVEEKKWLSESRFLHALSYCMLLPGPEAQQLATYMGWLIHGVRGGLIAGCLFIAPGFLSILGLSILYAGYQDVGFVAAVLFGLKPAVIAVVLHAVIGLRRRALTDALSVGLAGSAFIAIFVFKVPFPMILVAAAFAGSVYQRARQQRNETSPVETQVSPVQHPSVFGAGRVLVLWLMVWLTPLAGLLIFLGSDHVFVTEGVFFSKVAVVTFGGAYAVLSYVAQQAVDAYQWLRPHEMLDGLGLAESTPGPLIQVVQFVGFLGAYRNPGDLSPIMSGVFGSIVTTWFTFVPCFMFIFVGAPFVESLRNNKTLNAALRGITAAVVGVVFNLAVWFALHTLFAELQPLDFGAASILTPVPSTIDWRAVAIAMGSMVAMFRYKVGMIPTLAGAAVTGLAMSVIP